MRRARLFEIGIVFAILLSACTTPLPLPVPTPSNTATLEPTSAPTPTSTPVSTGTPVANAANPCIGAPAPAQWKHIVVLLFENKTYDEVIGPAPYITSLANQCATAPDWMDANTRVDGSPDGHYPSKPGYATLTNGLPPSVHGLTDDSYSTKTDVDNIYHQLNQAGISFKDYYEAEAGGCAVRFSGDYHDPIRYYTNVADVCSAHDIPLSTFMADVNSGNLPAFSMILPTNQHNMHDNSVASGDAYAQSVLDPLLNSPAYANGDLAIFFLWDEDTPIPNVLLAPSVIPGTTIAVQTGNPISHFSAVRTWEEMLGLPLLGETGSAPSLLPFIEGHAPPQ
jgi:phospholipase C